MVLIGSFLLHNKQKVEWQHKQSLSFIFSEKKLPQKLGNESPRINVWHSANMLCKEIVLLLYFLKYLLPRNILEHNKQVKRMYVMDIYSVKQPQNIILKVKMKEHKIGKKEYCKKVERNLHNCLYFSVRKLLVQLYLH